jgi:predicted transcriptional regulator
MPNLTLRHGKSVQCSPLRKRYRSYFEITASMLEAMTSCSQTTFTLMRQAGISYKLLKKYLEYLAESGLIETGISRGRISYRTSDKGRNFLRQYRILQEMLLTDGQDSAANLVCDVEHNATTKHNHSSPHLVTEIVRRP